MAKERLDDLLVRRGIAPSRDAAAALVMAGEIFVGGDRATKAGVPVAGDAEVEHRPRRSPHVGRGFHKLDGAVETLGIEVRDRICVDVGASTGGFTEVLLARGAVKVYAVDVGYGELAWKLRKDPRVVVMERTNARYLESLPEPVSLAVIDVSFISLTLILPAVRKWLREGGEIAALIKPQFEAAKDELPPGAVITDPAVRESIVERVRTWCLDAGFSVRAVVQSGLPGMDGNIEYFAHLIT